MAVIPFRPIYARFGALSFRTGISYTFRRCLLASAAQAATSMKPIIACCQYELTPFRLSPLRRIPIVIAPIIVLRILPSPRYSIHRQNRRSWPPLHIHTGPWAARNLTVMQPGYRRWTLKETLMLCKIRVPNGIYTQFGSFGFEAAGIYLAANPGLRQLLLQGLRP